MRWWRLLFAGFPSLTGNMVFLLKNYFFCASVSEYLSKILLLHANIQCLFIMFSVCFSDYHYYSDISLVFWIKFLYFISFYLCVMCYMCYCIWFILYFHSILIMRGYNSLAFSFVFFVLFRRLSWEEQVIQKKKWVLYAALMIQLKT